MEMTKGEGMTPEEYIAKLEKERDNCLKEVKLCYSDIHGLEGQISDLEEENKKLKSDLAYERTMLDNVRAEYESSQDVIKKLKEELSKYKEQYQHSMGFSDFGGYDEDEHIVKDENTYRDLDL